jgi:hypothetical protein
MHPGTLKYNEQQEPNHKEVCDLLGKELEDAPVFFNGLAEVKNSPNR